MDNMLVILFGGAAVVVAMLILRERRGPDVGRLRRGWGRASSRLRDFASIRAFHDALPRAGAIDERTWNDLCLDDVFARIDATESPIGQQVLYDMLRRPLHDLAALASRETAIAFFETDAGARERAQLLLARLHANDFYDLHELFTGELPETPRFARFAPLLTALAIALIVGAFVYPPVLFSFPALALANYIVQGSVRHRIGALVNTLRHMSALLATAEAIAALPEAPTETLREEIRRGIGALAPLRRASRWLVFEQGNTNEILGIIYAYLNYFFLLDVNAFRAAVDTIRKRGGELRAVFEAIGTLDAMIAIASYRAGTSTSAPSFTAAGRAIAADALAHPLIEDAVTNDLRIDGASFLITGSNMSGKTTFIRAAALASIMAQTVHTVTARRWKAPFLIVKTSIGGGDNILEGKSYYLAEVERIAELDRAAESDAQHLFVIDELFRGTNTVERIAAGAAILDRLNRSDHIVLASTHDLELVDLVKRYEFHHFAETVANGQLSFDYQLRPGRSSTRNAIAILGICGFPDEVVRDAEEIAARLTAREEAEA